MLARTVTILKWTLYAAAAVLCLFVQGAFLQRVTVWGVIPFLYPLLAAIPATYESPVSGTVFALCVGIFCDLLLPDPIPCLYTLPSGGPLRRIALPRPSSRRILLLFDGWGYGLFGDGRLSLLRPLD